MYQLKKTFVKLLVIDSQIMKAASIIIENSRKLNEVLLDDRLSDYEMLDDFDKIGATNSGLKQHREITLRRIKTFWEKNKNIIDNPELVQKILNII